MHVRFVVVVVALSAALAGGCSLPVPFSVDRTASVAVPLGPVDAACTNASGHVALRGVSGTFDHHRSGGVCVLSSSGSGPLVDLGAIEQQAGAAAVDITGLTIDVRRVALVDTQDGDAPIDPAGRRLLDAHVDVLDQNDVVVAHADGPQDPDVTVHVTQKLVNLVDDAWQQQAAINGAGAVELDQDLTRMDALAAAGRPAIAIDFTIHVEGTAYEALGG